jgi:Family of unknown function (DUF6502)
MRAPAKDTRDETALAHALEQVLAPLARLAVARGLSYPQLTDLLKQALVRAARAAQPAGGRRDVSRVATATGLTRREVTRLSQREAPAWSQRPPPATQLFTRWQADRKLRDRRGKPRVLPRQGPAPSFEALAQATTRDVHPRSLLEELIRLSLVAHDAASDSVRLIEDAFVPRDDHARMVGFLGHNVGDHLAASVANVLGDERKHFEQAVFADGLSEASVGVAKKLVHAQWRALMAALVPELEDLVKADEATSANNAAHRADRRLRVGLYSFDDAVAPADDKDI